MFLMNQDQVQQVLHQIKKTPLRRNKSNETPAVLIPIKEPIEETVNPINNIYQGDYLMHPENQIPHKMYRPFQHKVDYEGDANENNYNTNDSQLDHYDFVRNLDK